MNSIDRRLAKLQAKVSRELAAEREHEQYYDVTLVEVPRVQRPDIVRVSKAELDRITAAVRKISKERRGRGDSAAV